VSSTHHLLEYFENTFTASVLFSIFRFVIIINHIFQFNLFNTHKVSSSFIQAILIFSYHTLQVIFIFFFTFFLSILYSKKVTLFLVLIISAKVLSK